MGGAASCHRPSCVALPTSPPYDAVEGFLVAEPDHGRQSGSQPVSPKRVAVEPRRVSVSRKGGRQQRLHSPGATVAAGADDASEADEMPSMAVEAGDDDQEQLLKDIMLTWPVFAAFEEETGEEMDSIIEPDSALWHHLRGLLLEERGRVQEALLEYREAIEVDPRAARARHELARLLVALDEPREAEEQLRIILQQDGTDIRARQALGNVRLKQGDFEGAERELLVALALDEESTAVLKELGGLYVIQGRMPEAEVLYRRVVEADPEQDDAFDALVAIEHGEDPLLLI